MTKTRNRLAIVGCGGIAGYHMTHLTQFKDIELVGFCDLIKERAEDFVRQAGSGQAFTSHRDMFDAVKPDMIFICVPPDAHGAIEMDAIERGIHFFVQKPLALDIALAEKILAAAEAKGLITAVGFQCRYSDINEPALDFVRKNEIVFVDASRVGGVPSIDWWRKKARSGGQLAEQTIHQVDILRYLLGDAKTVYSISRRGYISQQEWPGYDTDDLSATLIQFESGVVCHLMTGCYEKASAAWDSKMTFGTRESRMDYRLIDSVTVYREKPAEPAAKGLIAGDGARFAASDDAQTVTKNTNDFGAICDRTFIDAVLSGDASKIRSSYADGLKTLKLVLACNRSMESGQPEQV